MSTSTRAVRWITDDEVSVATALGLLSIPFTIALSLETAPEHLNFGPVLYAGVLAGWYYSDRDVSLKRVGVRTGVIGGVTGIWTAVHGVADAASISPRYGALGVVFATLWLGFSLAVGALAGVVGAVIGGTIARLLPSVRGLAAGILWFLVALALGALLVVGGALLAIAIP